MATSKYTPEELDRFARHDLKVDLECAVRDGLTEYAKHIREQLTRIDAGESAHKVVLLEKTPGDPR